MLVDPSPCTRGPVPALYRLYWPFAQAFLFDFVVGLQRVRRANMVVRECKKEKTPTKLRRLLVLWMKK